MKIGIDAKWLFRGHISGRLFIQNLLPELLSLYPEAEWHIFLDKKDKQRPIPFKKENINIHYVWCPSNMFTNLFVLPPYIQKLNLDAVLFQTYSPKGRSFNSIVFTHDVLFKNYPRYFSWKERAYFYPLNWTIGRADKVITTTQFVKNELLKFNFVKEEVKIDIAPSGISSNFKPVSQFEQSTINRIKSKYNLPESYLLYVGRINTRKNIQALIKALPLLDDKKIPLVVVGEKNRKLPRLNSLLATKEIKNRVIFTAAIPDEHLPVIYSLASVFCFPSFAEGFGSPPLEAMAAGLPVVVSDRTSLPEVCGNPALYINPDDPTNIAATINIALKPGSDRESRIKEGLEWSRNFTWEKTAQKIMKSIFSTIEAKGNKNLQ